jgi:antiviral helicase SLH1
MSSDNCPMEVKGGATSAQGKVNILLQAHISKVFIEDFALVSDAAYVAQNAGRIIRALLEIALSRNWANCALLLIDLSKAIERRMWPYEHPLGQIGSLQRETLYNLRRWADDTEINELREMDPKEIGEMVHMNTHHGTALHNAAMMFPTIGVTHALRPLAHDLLQITVTVKPEFVWNTKLSGSSEPFYVWVQDAEGLHILQWRSILLRQSTSSLDIEFVIPWTPGEHESLSIVTASDRWLGSDSQAAVSLSGLVMPPRFEDTTPLLDLPFLPITALDDPALVSAYRPHVPMLNCIQTQAFWSIYHTNHSVLVSAPVSSGKSLLGELAIWHAFKHAPVGLALVLVPSARAASETAARIRGVAKGTAVTHVRSADALETAVTADGQRVVVATPGALATFTPKQLYDLGHKLTVVVLEDLHHLDALYELAVTKLLSVTRAARTRLVGLTCSLADPSDLASWLGIDPTYAFAFTPRDRGSPLVVQLKTFSIPHSATLLKTMVKPTYDIVKGATGPVVVFVPSRAAARSAATDMVTQSGTAMDLNGFLQADRADVEPLLTRLVDSSLLEPILHGIGYVLPRMAASDLALVLELFASGILKALVAPRDAAWTLPVRASTVVLMGAQYVRFDPATDERTVCNYPRADLVRMQGFAVQSAHPATPGGRMFVMCQPEQQVGIARTLGDGLPLESGLPAVLRRDVNAHVNGDRDRDRNRNRDASLALTALDSMLPMRPAPPPPSAHRPPVQSDLRARDLSDLLGWTYFGRRARASPSYYDIEGPDSVSRLVDAWFAGKEREEREKVKEVERKEREKGKGKKADKMNEKGKEKEEVAEPGVDADGDANADADAGGHDGEADPRSVAPPADGHEYIIEEIEVHADTDSDSD